MSLRKRNYLIESNDVRFKKGSFDIEITTGLSRKPEAKKVSGYVAWPIGIAKYAERGREWNVIHIPTGSLIASYHGLGQLTKLSDAKKLASAAYKFMSKSGTVNADVVSKLEMYKKYLAKGGKEDFDTWQKRRQVKRVCVKEVT